MGHNRIFAACRENTILSIKLQEVQNKKLNLTDGIMLVTGSMIGSGIFIVSADIARNLGSGGWLLMAWLIAGLMTIMAALSYGELASLIPNAGGQYV